jgi:hypothetical protein
MERKLRDTPKVIRKVSVYFLPNESISASHLVEHLRRDKAVSEDTSLSYYLSSRNAYVFGVTVPKEGSFLPAEEEIQPKFIENGTVRGTSFSCT